MAQTLTSLLTQVRSVLNDSEANDIGRFRYTNADLLQYLNAAYDAILELRPDAWHAYFGVDLPYVDVNIYPPVPDTFPLDPRYFQPVADYIIGYAELRDDAFTVDSRAVTMIRSFRQRLTSPIGYLGATTSQ